MDEHRVASSRSTASGCLLRQQGLKRVYLLLLCSSFVIALVGVLRPKEEVLELLERSRVGDAKDGSLASLNEVRTSATGSPPAVDSARRPSASAAPPRQLQLLADDPIRSNYGPGQQARQFDAGQPPPPPPPQSPIRWAPGGGAAENWMPVVVQIPAQGNDQQPPLGAAIAAAMSPESLRRIGGEVPVAQLEQRPSRVELASPKGNLAGLEEVQKNRQARMAYVCRQNAELRLRQRMWMYKMDRVHGLTYCPVPKAGWSSWKRLLFYINGAINSTDVEIGITSDSKAGVVDVGPVTVQRLQAMRRPMFMFAFVRNPWERLVSAYINKAVDWNYTRIMHAPCRWESVEPYKEPITFTQFLTCISESGINTSLDIHWTPMWQLCDFCRTRYDYVGHMESVAADARYILERNSINATFPRIFSSKAHRAGDVIVDWYRAVPIDVIQSLQRLYRLDFLLHGYSNVPPGWEGKLA